MTCPPTHEKRVDTVPEVATCNKPAQEDRNHSLKKERIATLNKEVVTQERRTRTIQKAIKAGNCLHPAHVQQGPTTKGPPPSNDLVASADLD